MLRAPGQTKINFPVIQDRQQPGPSRARSRSPPRPFQRSKSEEPPARKYVETGAGIKRPRPTSAHAKFNPSIYRVAAAFKNATLTWKLMCTKHDASGVAEILDLSTKAMKSRLSNFRAKNPALKFNMAIHVIFKQETDELITTFPPVVLATEQFEVYPDNDLDSMLKVCSEQLQNRIVSYQGFGSGWTVREIRSLDTTVWLLNPLRGESYHPLSKWIQNTKCVVNVQNEGNRCFEDAVMAALYTPKTNRSRPGSYKEFYKREDAPSFKTLNFPIKIRDILRFEKDNEE